jgi:glutamate dehydrogenase
MVLPTGRGDVLVQLTQLLQQNGLLAARKSINTFANQATIVSLYLVAPPPDALAAFLNQIKLCHILPRSDLTPNFLKGTMSVEEYSYASAVGRFVYYFINARTEEYEALLHSLSGVNLGRLKSMHTKMKRDSQSPARIQEVLMKNQDVMKLLTQDFRDRTLETGQQTPELTDTIVSQIARLNSPSEQYILQAILLFNTCVVRTNFFKSDKEALCFRLEFRFMSDSDWPANPYAVYFVMGSDFQGFHVRFRDISRGGIRLIRSRDTHHYAVNLQTQFAET